jgi:hypothetical protein
MVTSPSNPRRDPRYKRVSSDFWYDTRDGTFVDIDDIIWNRRREQAMVEPATPAEATINLTEDKRIGTPDLPPGWSPVSPTVRKNPGYKNPFFNSVTGQEFGEAYTSRLEEEVQKLRKQRRALRKEVTRLNKKHIEDLYYIGTQSELIKLKQGVIDSQNQRIARLAADLETIRGVLNGRT